VIAVPVAGKSVHGGPRSARTGIGVSEAVRSYGSISPALIA
jgi:hypothetical protein